MLSYVLNREVSGDIILRDIQQLVTKRLSESNKPLILVIDVKDIVQETTDHIPKIEYQSLDQ